MSAIRFDKYWQEEAVMPYLKELFDTHNCRKMYLMGSRGKVPFEEWEKLKGKDWDVMLETDEPHEYQGYKKLIDPSYHVDIMYIGDNLERIQLYRNIGYDGCRGGFELFPNTPEQLKEFLTNKLNQDE